MPRVRRRMVLVVAFAATLALATYAFTASNTVPGTKAGKGEGAITGYTVSGDRLHAGGQPGEHRQRRVHPQRVGGHRQGQGRPVERDVHQLHGHGRYERLVQLQSGCRCSRGRRALGRRRLVVGRRPGSVRRSPVSSPRHEEVPRHSPDARRRSRPDRCGVAPLCTRRARRCDALCGRRGREHGAGPQSRRSRARARGRRARRRRCGALPRPDAAVSVFSIA